MLCAYVDTNHKYAEYFSILNGVKTEITHSIAPVGLD